MLSPLLPERVLSGASGANPSHGRRSATVAGGGGGGGSGLLTAEALCERMQEAADVSPLERIAGLLNASLEADKLTSEALSLVFETVTSYKQNDTDLGDVGMMVRAPGVALLLCRSAMNQLLIAVDKHALPRLQQRLIKLTQVRCCVLYCIVLCCVSVVCCTVLCCVSVSVVCCTVLCCAVSVSGLCVVLYCAVSVSGLCGGVCGSCVFTTSRTGTTCMIDCGPSHSSPCALPPLTDPGCGVPGARDA